MRVRWLLRDKREKKPSHAEQVMSYCRSSAIDSNLRFLPMLRLADAGIETGARR